jgi:hypothetical protein
MPTLRDHPRWAAALDLAERLYRAAESLRGRDAWLADRLAALALGLPGALDEPARLARCHRDLEAALALAARLRLLESKQLLEALVAFEGTAPAPAPVAPVGAPPPAAVPARPASPGRPAAPAPAQAPPRDRLFVDGCNFLGRAEGYALGDDRSRERLVTRLQDYAHRHPAHRVTAFFDGKRAVTRTVAGVQERVTAEGRSADDTLVEALGALAQAERRRAVVVTDDRGLAQRARSLGSRVEGIAWLQERLREPPRQPASHSDGEGLSDRQVAEWEEFFSRPPQRPGRSGGA